MLLASLITIFLLSMQKLFFSGGNIVNSCENTYQESNQSHVIIEKKAKLLKIIEILTNLPVSQKKILFNL